MESNNGEKLNESILHISIELFYYSTSKHKIFELNTFLFLESHIKSFFHDLRCNSKKVPCNSTDFDTVNFRSTFSFFVWKINF